MSATKKRYKFLGLFSVIRGYNVLLLSIAQYLASIFVFAVNETLGEVLFDLHLNLVVLATVFVVSAGYIINDFYDVSLDVVNKPVKTHIGNWVSKKTKLDVYFLFNFIAVCLAFLVSWRAAAFFSLYIFCIWLYSHKLQKYPLIRVFSVSILDVLPFFVVFVYYNHISLLILVHGTFLYGLILLKEIIKDFRRTRGAILNNRKTLITEFGAAKVKAAFFVLMLLVLVPTYFLLQFPEIGAMQYYFYALFLIFPLVLVLTIKARKGEEYLRIHNLLKITLVAGVFCLMLIDTSVLIIRVLNQVKI